MINHATKLVSFELDAEGGNPDLFFFSAVCYIIDSYDAILLEIITPIVMTPCRDKSDVLLRSSYLSQSSVGREITRFDLVS